MFALTRDELIECLTLVRAVRQGKLDTIEIPEQSTDVLCQQIIAECALDEQDFDSLYELVRTAWPFRNLSRSNLMPLSRCWVTAIVVHQIAARICMLIG